MVWIGLHPVDGNWAWTNSDPLSGYVLFTDLRKVKNYFQLYNVQLCSKMTCLLIFNCKQCRFENWKSDETPTMGKCVTALHKVCCSNSGYKGEWRTVRGCGNSNPYVCKLSTSPAATTTTTEATTAETTTTTAVATIMVAATTIVETTATDFMTTTKTPGMKEEKHVTKNYATATYAIPRVFPSHTKLAMLSNLWCLRKEENNNFSEKGTSIQD